MNSFWIFILENSPALLMSSLLGAFVGSAEVMSRYKDEPLVALRSSAGTAYVVMNGVVSLVACAMLLHYVENKGLPAILKGEPLMISITAGLAAMTLMRSKLFTIKSEGGNEYSIGPDIIFSMFLKTIDRKIDRMRSKLRQRIVYEAVAGIRDFNKAISFLQASIAAFQNLSQDERTSINDRVEQISRDDKLDTQLKLMHVCYLFLDIAGEDNFKEFVSRLNHYLNDSSERMHLVFSSISSVEDPIGAFHFMRMALSAFPNLTESEKRDLNEMILNVAAKTDLNDQMKLMAVCTEFLNQFGESNFITLMDLLRKHEQARTTRPVS